MKRRVLLTAGPSTTSAAVRQALITPDLNHREPAFRALLAETLQWLHELAGCAEGDVVIPVTGSGTAAIEAALCSFVPPASRLLVLTNGDYGTRIARIAERMLPAVHTHEAGAGNGIDPAAVAAVLAAAASAGRAYTHVALVHHETSTGMLNPLDELCGAAHAHGARVLADCVASIGALPVRVGADAADILVGSANKCIQGMAGLAFVVVRGCVLAESAAHVPRSFYLDLHAEHAAIARTGEPRFTCPAHVLAALHRALIELQREGVAARGARYASNQDQLIAALQPLGFEPLLPPGSRSGILVTFRVPADFDFTAVQAALLADGFLIYPPSAAAPGTLRLGVLGDIDSQDITDFVAAFRRCLSIGPHAATPGAAS